MSYECNLTSNRIGVITVKRFNDFKLALSEVTGEFEVEGKDGFIWGAGKSPKGAVISACRCGIKLKDIDFNGIYVPRKQVIEAIKQ